MEFFNRKHNHTATHSTRGLSTLADASTIVCQFKIYNKQLRIQANICVQFFTIFCLMRIVSMLFLWEYRRIDTKIQLLTLTPLALSLPRCFLWNKQSMYNCALGASVSHLQVKLPSYRLSTVSHLFGFLISIRLKICVHKCYLPDFICKVQIYS